MSTSRFLIQRIYGYLVCIVAIITLLISSSVLINSIFDLSRPQNPFEMSQGQETEQSFEEYRLQQLERAVAVKEKTGRSEVIPSDTALRRMYEDAQRSRERKQKEQLTTRTVFDRWNAQKGIATSALLIVVAIVLFTLHWRWVRSLDSRSNNE